MTNDQENAEARLAMLASRTENLVDLAAVTSLRLEVYIMLARSERFVAGIAIVAICVSALTYAALPIFPVVLAGSVLHAFASCVLGPAMVAISIGLVGHAAIGERLGRNARYAAVGNGLAAVDTVRSLGSFGDRLAVGVALGKRRPGC